MLLWLLLTILTVNPAFAQEAETIVLTLCGDAECYREAIPHSATPVWAVIQPGDTLTATVDLNNLVPKDDWELRVIFGDAGQWGWDGTAEGGHFIQGFAPGEWIVIPGASMPGRTLVSFGVVNDEDKFKVALPRKLPDLTVELWRLLDAQGGNIALANFQILPGPYLHAASISAECEAMIPTAEILMGPRPDINAYPCQDATGSAIWGNPLVCQGNLAAHMSGQGTQFTMANNQSDFYNSPFSPLCVPNSCGAGPLDRPCF